MTDKKERRPLEPRGTFDRILYAALAINGPTAVVWCFTSEHADLRFSGYVMGVWTLIATLYTIEWAIVSYRKWRRG